MVIMPRSAKLRGRTAKTAGQTASNGTDDRTLQSSDSLPLELQQIILNTFQSIIPATADRSLTEIIQEVKGHLYNRDFETAFAKLEYTQAYATRWSAARALGYASMFSDPGRRHLFQGPEADPAEDKSSEGRVSFNVVCIGGGAGAELVGLAASQRLMVVRQMQLTAVDLGDWSQTIQQLRDAVFEPKHLPRYASQSARDRPENQPLLQDESDFAVSFVRQDVLSWSSEETNDAVHGAALVTIMFTLNELFTTSLPKTTTFLLLLTQHMQSGSHLLVVDSPGSYSEIRIAKSEGQQEAAVKKYPMKWMLDHNLLEVAKQNDKPAWEKIESEDSLWFRLDQRDRAKLKYPIELENMRYQLHCYRRL